ncbi:unnamed protein product [Eruca vesicaria subsp. sativa]|uniref:Uncharacterized protein n=1 Tax=Eruca vesicaria subsp. sativa TaxID=29727 RepID=A0ABC8L9V0_ERUVS|nr:unnamed protein product [Eruca vesicaria subsp. sativa]
MDPPQTPSTFMKARPSTASSILTKLTVNFVLPYASELSEKEIFFVIGGEQHLLHLRVCVTCFVSFAGVQGRDGVEAMEPGHGDSGTGHGSYCVQNLEFPE